MGVAAGTAALIAGGLGAAGTVASGIMSSNAVGSAAQAQQAAQQSALGEQQREFNVNQANFAPWLAAGQSALGAQRDLLGIGGTPDWNGYLQQNPDVAQAWQNLTPAQKTQFPTAQSFAQYQYQNYGQNEGRAPPVSNAGAVQQSAINSLQASPLYQSLYKTGLQTTLNNSAATGGLRGGNTQTGLYNLGQQTLAQVIQNQLNNLGGISSTGQTSATSLGNLGGTTSNNISNLLTQQGQTQAGGILGQQGIWNNALNSIPGQFSNAYANYRAAQPSGFSSGLGSFDPSSFASSSNVNYSLPANYDFSSY
jgi:hypothetical protein